MNPKHALVLLAIGIAGGVFGAFLFQNANQQNSVSYGKLISTPLTEISSYQLLQKMSNNGTDYIIIDVRDKDSCELGRIKGAICIPLDQLKKNYNSLPKDKTIVVACWSSECMLGPTSAAFLASKGIFAKELRIGWCEWSERGYPIDGERYILKNECLQPQRSINNETVIVMDSVPNQTGPSCSLDRAQSSC